MILYRSRLIGDLRIKPTHLALYAAIAHKIGCDTSRKYTYCSRRELMKCVGFQSNTTYHNCLKDLVSFGYLRYIPSYLPSNRSYFEILY